MIKHSILLFASAIMHGFSAQAEELSTSMSILDSLNIPDYVHIPLNFTLSKKKFSEIAEMSVQMFFNDDASELQTLADALSQPSDFINELELCWMEVTEDEDEEEYTMRKGHCVNVPMGENVGYHTTVGTKWSVAAYLPPVNEDSEEEAQEIAALFTIVGGKFHYNLVEILTQAVVSESQGESSCEAGSENEQCVAIGAEGVTLSGVEKRSPLRFDDVAYVNNPHECGPPGAAFDYMGPTWRDGVRTAAHRRGLALCFCGAYNDTTHTTYTLETPNLEYPSLPNEAGQDLCDCNGMTSARSFDYWFPCHFNTKDPGMLIAHTDCELLNQQQQAGIKPTSEIRMHLIHSTVQVDRLSMKQKMWDSAKRVYGVDKAAMMMPMSFNLLEPVDPDEHRLLMSYCDSILDRGLNKELVFVTKNVNLHQQHGISLASAGALRYQGVTGGFSFATAFLPRPFTVNGYKINMRRYLVAVCTRTASGEPHLRGYVHDDGKNIYTKYKYRDPWVGEAWEGNPTAIKQRLGELITSGYVDKSHFDDKPLSGLEFFSYVDNLSLPEEVDRSQYYNSTMLQMTMWTRLALSMHASIVDGDFHLCETEASKLRCEEVPSCLTGAIRFQHFGCDFHIDKHLTGREAKLFECNKGPDFSVHSERDGKLKREVAADIVSFMGFKGPFEGTAEQAKKYRMNLIYDSETFQSQQAFDFLESRPL